MARFSFVDTKSWKISGIQTNRVQQQPDRAAIWCRFSGVIGGMPNSQASGKVLELIRFMPK